ncbi:MAG: hypothetical protein M3N52_11865 [Actinomycetota bacterium]|nr:hypothetical protein [Actinomycetota bacterium]
MDEPELTTDHGLTVEPLVKEAAPGWEVLKHERAFRRRWGFWPKQYTTDPAELSGLPAHTREAMLAYTEACEQEVPW